MDTKFAEQISEIRENYPTETDGIGYQAYLIGFVLFSSIRENLLTPKEYAKSVEINHDDMLAMAEFNTAVGAIRQFMEKI